MPFAPAQVLTNVERAMVADRVRTTPSTYTNAPKFLGVGVGATAAGRTAAATDNALSTPVESRTSGTESLVTTTLANDTLQIAGTITFTAPRNVDEGGLFDAASGGNMIVSWTQLPDAFGAGDSYAITLQIQWL